MSKMQKVTPKKESLKKNSELSPAERSRNRAKKTVVIVLVATVVLVLLYMIPYDAILDWMFPKEELAPEDIFFYEADFETDILKDVEYMALNRFVSLTHGNETFVITDGDFEPYGKAPVLIGRYFRSLIQGDAEAYNELFSREYLDEHGLQEAFPMQRVYDMKVKLYSEHTFTDEELDGKYAGIIQYRYEVSYRIQYNDGSVRRDVGSGEAKPIYMEILVDPEVGTVEINSISFGESAGT